MDVNDQLGMSLDAIITMGSPEDNGAAGQTDSNPKPHSNHHQEYRDREPRDNHHRDRDHRDHRRDRDRNDRPERDRDRGSSWERRGDRNRYDRNERWNDEDRNRSWDSSNNHYSRVPYKVPDLLETPYNAERLPARKRQPIFNNPRRAHVSLEDRALIKTNCFWFGNEFRVKLYETEILCFCKNITIRTGGFQTRETFYVLNEALSVIGYKILESKNENGGPPKWNLTDTKTLLIPFSNGMVIHPPPAMRGMPVIDLAFLCYQHLLAAKHEVRNRRNTNPITRKRPLDEAEGGGAGEMEEPAAKKEGNPWAKPGHVGPHPNLVFVAKRPPAE